MKWSEGWTVLTACYTVSFIWVLNNSSLPILLPLIKQEFSLTYFESGLISTASMLAYCAMQFPIGLLADRMGKKQVIMTGTFWVAVTLILTGLSQTYSQFLLCLIIVGIGNGMHFIPTSTLVSESFNPKERGKALSISGSAMAISRVSTALFAVPVAVALGWRNLFLLFSLCGFLAGAVFWRIVKEKNVRQDANLSMGRIGEVREFFRPDLMKISTIAHLMGYTIVVQVFLPLFLMQRYGMGATEAAFHSIIPSIAWGLGAPVNGILIDRLGRKKAILAASLMLSASSTTLVLLSNYALAVGMLAVIGFANGLANPAILAYSADIVRENVKTSEMGMMNTFWVLGSVIGPTIGGIIADIAGLEAAFLAFSATPIVAIILVLAWLRD